MCINVSARLSAFQNRYIKQLLKFLEVLKQFLVLVWCFGVQITDAKPVELTVSRILSTHFAETPNNVLSVLENFNLSSQKLKNLLL